MFQVEAAHLALRCCALLTDDAVSAAQQAARAAQHLDSVWSAATCIAAAIAAAFSRRGQRWLQLLHGLHDASTAEEELCESAQADVVLAALATALEMLLVDGALMAAAMRALSRLMTAAGDESGAKLLAALAAGSNALQVRASYSCMPYQYLDGRYLARFI